MLWPFVTASKPFLIAASSEETLTEYMYPTLQGFLFLHAFTTRPPCFRPIWVWANTTFPDSPASGGRAVPGFVPRIWSILTTLMPAWNACLTVSRSCGPKMGCRMIALYCFDC